MLMEVDVDIKFCRSAFSHGYTEADIQQARSACYQNSPALIAVISMFQSVTLINRKP